MRKVTWFYIFTSVKQSFKMLTEGSWIKRSTSAFCFHDKSHPLVFGENR